MSLELVESRKSIKKIQAMLNEALLSKLTGSLECTIGFPGCSWRTNVNHDESIWFHSFMLDRDGTSPRYWNGFGLAEKLDANKSNNIVVEINIPLSGINRNVSGAFAQDSDGKSYLLHRGRIGGGRKGIGRQAFLNWTSKDPTTVSSSKGSEECIVIGCINDEVFLHYLSDFVQDVAQFKSFISERKFDDPGLLSLEELEKLIADPVTTENASTNRYSRSNLVKEHAKRRANGVCQLCDKGAPFFDKYGKPFLEVHHIEWLSRNGEDSISNTVALCPNCHRKMHIVDDSLDKKYLSSKV